MIRNIIYTNDYSIEEYREFLEQEYPDSENIWDEIVMETIELNLEDERTNLDIRLGENIVALADIGRWNGRVNGYKELGNNLANILYSSCDGDVEWFVDGTNVRCTESHHDGTNYITYRVWSEGLSDAQKDNFITKWLEGVAASKDITRYTKSLKPYVDKVYNW